MAHSNFKTLLILVFIGAGFSACTMKKALRGPSEGAELSSNLKELEKAVMANTFEFEYLSLRGSGTFDGMGMQQNLSLVMRMKRHEIVWISAQAMLGIEVGRALITKDSVYLIQNFPERSYREFSLDSLSTILSVPLSVTQLQDFFVGNPLLPYDPAQATLLNDTIVVEKNTKDFILHELFAVKSPKIIRNELKSKVQRGKATVDYLAFEKQGNKEMPVKVNIFVERPDLTANLDLQYSNISFDPISSFPFRKPN